MSTTPFLAGLEAEVRRQQQQLEAELLPLDLALLNHKPAPGSWSVLECVEHLNRYARYYLPVLAKALSRPPVAGAAPFRPSWLGRKFVAMMEPTNTRKHTTLKHMNPAGSALGPAVLAEFQQHQARLLALLAQAGTADLNRKAVPVEFLKLLKMNVGESLQFVIVHQQRHLAQAQRVLRMELVS